MKNQRLSSVLFLLALAGSVLSGPSAAEKTTGGTLRVDAGRIEERILELARFGANPEGGVSRVAFGDADIEGRRYIVSLMEEAGLDVRIDEAGNILGHRAGTVDGLPPILFGSHIDSVPKGGNYDGDVGVSLTVELADKPKRVGRIVVDLELPEGVPEDRKKAIKRVAEQCPIHETLKSPPALDIDVV